MLAKVLKNPEATRFTAFSMPEIGEARHISKSVSEFVLPNFDDFLSADELIELDPQSPRGSENIIQNARDEAERIIARAEEHGSMIEQGAVDKAEHEANAALEAQVSLRVAEMREQLTKTIDQISALSGKITTRAETSLVELALQIAKKIVGREITLDREIAFTHVKTSLSKLHDRSIAEVRLNPEDLAFVQSAREKLEFRGSLELVEDPSISLGGCLIHTETGDIDARIESQFNEIAHGLFG
jgi:flagellar assembly protein FliH